MKTKFWAREASLLALSLVVFSAPAAPALADDTAEEIRLLKAQLKQIGPLTQRLKQLEEKVARQEREKKELRAQAGGAYGNAGLVVKGPAESAPLPFFIDLDHGLTVESLDHSDKFHVGGRIYVDGGASSLPEKGYASTANLAQARLQVEGRLRNIWEYKLQYDFVGGGNATTVGAVGGIRDAYLALKYPGFRPPFLENPIEIQVGNFYLPHGMERTESKNYIDFIERALMSDTFGAARHVGVALLDHGSNWSFKTALSSTSVEDKALTPTAGYPVPLGVTSKAGWFATGGSQYYDITARATYAPIWDKEKGELLHIGASGRYHRPNDATAINDDRVLTPGANTNIESNILKENLLGTPDLSCGAYGVAGNPATAGHCVRNVVTFGAEIAGAYGPLSVQAEYMNAQYNRNASSILASNIAGALTPGGSSLNFDGYYVSGIYFLTGESKAASYQVDSNTNGGGFEQIKIKHPLSAGGWGAFALTARYSEVNLNNGPYQGSSFFNAIALAPTQAGKNAIYNSGVLGGREEDVTVGLNWYADRGIRIMANWTRVLALSAPSSSPFYNGAHPNTFLVRTQVDW